MYTIDIQRVRAILLEPALEAFEAQRAPNDPTRNGRVGCSRIRARGARFHDHILEAGGGAIDLACRLGGWNFRAAVIWLSGNANRLRRADRVLAATPAPERARPLPPSVSDPDLLAHVVGYLTGPGAGRIPPPATASSCAGSWAGVCWCWAPRCAPASRWTTARAIVCRSASPSGSAGDCDATRPMGRSARIGMSCGSRAARTRSAGR